MFTFLFISGPSDSWCDSVSSFINIQTNYTEVAHGRCESSTAVFSHLLVFLHICHTYIFQIIRLILMIDKNIKSWFQLLLKKKQSHMYPALCEKVNPHMSILCAHVRRFCPFLYSSWSLLVFKALLFFTTTEQSPNRCYIYC